MAIALARREPPPQVSRCSSGRRTAHSLRTQRANTAAVRSRQTRPARSGRVRANAQRAQTEARQVVVVAGEGSSSGPPPSGRSHWRPMLRSELCCVWVLEHEGHPTACVPNAPCAEGDEFDRCLVSATYFRLVCDHATITLRLDHESLDSTNMYVEAGTELRRCVLHRIGRQNRQARPLAPRAALLAFLESLQSTQTMLRPQARSPAAAPTFDRGQHISKRNIGRHMLRATYGD